MPLAVPASPRWSLHARLLAIAALAVLAAWAAGGWATVLSAREVAARLQDERLAQVARTVLAFAEHELAEIAQETAPALPHVEPGVALDNRYRLQIWSSDGRLLLRSANAQVDAPFVARGGSGFVDGRLGAEPARVYREAAVALAIEVQVAETLVDRRGALPLPGPGFVLAGLASVLAIVGLAWWQVLRALRPVADAERDLRERAPLDLTPLPTADAPRELAPMLAALNALFGRVEHQLSRERGFTALAAHELRAPLAALRMQAQVASRTPDAGRRGELLDALLASVDRCGHLLEQLLTLSRVDDPTATRATGPVALAAAFDAVRATLAAEIAGRGVRLTTDFAAPALHADPFGLETLLRNLLHNAIAHAPRGGRVQVASVAQDGAVLLRVDDDGPGIAPADRERVFGRFVRLAAPGFGVGLGLSIVQSVARAHGAVVTLGDSPLGGLRVELRFPAPPR
jgi:signal transduction histidine kinase